MAVRMILSLLKLVRTFVLYSSHNGYNGFRIVQWDISQDKSKAFPIKYFVRFYCRGRPIKRTVFIILTQ